MKAAIACILLLLLLGCVEESVSTTQNTKNTKEPPPSKYIDVPPLVRKNLGIQFVSVEMRDIQKSFRLPGVFEQIPEAQRSYQAPVEGQIHIYVRELQSVQTGDLLFSMESAELQKLQQNIFRLQDNLWKSQVRSRSLEVQKELHQKFLLKLEERTAYWNEKKKVVAGHQKELVAQNALWRERISLLEDYKKQGGTNEYELNLSRMELGKVKIDVRKVQEEMVMIKLNYNQTDLDKVNTTRELSKIEREITLEKEHQEHLKTEKRILLRTLSLYSGETVEVLEKLDNKGLAKWQRISRLNVRAQKPGFVTQILESSGSWVEKKSLVLETVDNNQIRFAATVLQSEMGKITNAKTAKVIPPFSNRFSSSKFLEGKMVLGPLADAKNLSLPVYCFPSTKSDWARPGISAYLEITLKSTQNPETSIPKSAIIQDGLDKVFYLRNPNNPNQVERVVADLGVSDEKWVAIQSGLIEGDEVVVEGVYELKLTGAGKALKGGHFHADGTWHDGDH